MQSSHLAKKSVDPVAAVRLKNKSENDDSFKFISMIKYILTDIEGTTTSISFVVDCLFPYFLEHVDELKDSIDTAFVQNQIDKVKQTVLDEENKNISTDQAFEYLILWCKNDRKHPALKALQGMVWEKAYQNGSIKGHIYPEVANALKRWKSKDIILGIYSSGSVAAQKLLFGFSEAGDLNSLFAHNFDTAVGHKREVASYENIRKDINFEASEILFLSDIEEELDAAASAGLRTIKLIRPGTKAVSKYTMVNNFDEIDNLIF